MVKEQQPDKGQDINGGQLIEVPTRLTHGGEVTVIIMPGENGEPGKVLDIVRSTGTSSNSN